MRIRSAIGVMLLGSILSFPAVAQESDYARTGQDLREHRDTQVTVDGYLRGRTDALFNLDLDRGPTPSGQYVYPLPVTNPRNQWLTHADMRLRTDLALYGGDGTVAVKTRIDLLDNLSLGSTPDGTPLTTDSQLPPAARAFQIRRAYGEAVTPIGLFTLGRMGAHWGLGMLAHGGDCASCDSGDAADRVAFMTPIADHVWAVAYDFSYMGPTVLRRSGNRELDLDPSDNVRTLTFAFMNWAGQDSRERRLEADVPTFEYGGIISHRWQQNDIPAAWVPTEEDVVLTPDQAVERRLTATAFDVWLRFTHPWMRLEAEAALITGQIEHPSLVPGVELDTDLTSLQYGAAFESDFGPRGGNLSAGIDAGFASGDSAPGFGSFPDSDAQLPEEGDFQGPQASPPSDPAVNNFRFHPDYRVDRILFRELIGTVTDATYVRPHVDWRLLDEGPSEIVASAAAVASWAVNEQSTPGGARPLGLELDPTLTYRNEDGFSMSFIYGVLFPGAGFDNPELGRQAQPAHLFRWRVIYGF
ncbi:MAG: TIGR04551 family protein [Myxococcota bacterium]